MFGRSAEAEIPVIRSSVRRRDRILWTLVVPMVALDVAVLGMADLSYRRWIAESAILALAFTQVSLLIMWSGLGQANAFVRLGGAVAGIAAWSLIACWWQSDRAWAVVWILQAASMAMAMSIWRLLAVRAVGRAAFRNRCDGGTSAILRGTWHIGRLADRI
jgi:hypothetical protein